MFDKYGFLIEKKSNLVHFFLTILWVSAIALIGYADYKINYFDFFIFYVMILVFNSMFISISDGITASLIIGVVNYFGNKEHLIGATQFLLYLNFFLNFLVFFIIAVIVGQTRKSLLSEMTLSRTDYMTGAVNKRFFTEILGHEIDRMKRGGLPFSLVFIDMDNFKKANDTFGHSAGDSILKTGVLVMKSITRKIDTTCRLGGDEFLILMPNTDSKDSLIVLSRLQEKFLSAMQENNYPVTLSIGVVAFNEIPESVDAAIKAGDAAMYEAKNSGKSKIVQKMYK
jgi:diguanylate cyclase (GGDEF)-like protein